MKKLLFFALFSWVFISEVDAQNNFNVIAVDGLYMRATPNAEGRRLYRFLFGEELRLVDTLPMPFQSYEFSLDDPNSWFRVQNHQGVKGYVYGYYLSPKVYPPNPPYTDDEYGSRNTTIYTDAATIIVPNYQNEGLLKRNDTIYIGEAVFNEIGDKVIYVMPKDSQAVVQVEYTCVEELNPWGARNAEGQLVPKWKHHEPFEQLPSLHQYFFSIPVTQYDSIRERSARALQLERSPNWDHVGEGWWVPMYVYHETIVPYQITSVLMKVTLHHKKGAKEEIILNFGLSYGC